MWALSITCDTRLVVLKWGFFFPLLKYLQDIFHNLLPCCISSCHHSRCIFFLLSPKASIGSFHLPELKNVRIEAGFFSQKCWKSDQSSCHGERALSPAFYFSLPFEDVAVIWCSLDRKHLYMMDLRLSSVPKSPCTKCFLWNRWVISFPHICRSDSCCWWIRIQWGLEQMIFVSGVLWWCWCQEI